MKQDLQCGVRSEMLFPVIPSGFDFRLRHPFVTLLLVIRDCLKSKNKSTTYLKTKLFKLLKINGMVFLEFFDIFVKILLVEEHLQSSLVESFLTEFMTRKVLYPFIQACPSTAFLICEKAPLRLSTFFSLRTFPSKKKKPTANILSES